MASATLAWSDLDCFALPPLAAQAVSGRVTVCPPCATSGRTGAAEVRDYTRVDLDVWARSCLADLDALSSEPFASIAQQFAAAPSERLRRACHALAEVIAARLRPIRAGACDADTLGAARALLARRLRCRLADAYRIAAVVKVVDRLLLIDATSVDRDLDAVADQRESPPLAPPFPLRAAPDGPLLVVQTAHFAPAATSVEAALCYDVEWQFDAALLPHDRIDIRIDLDVVAPTPALATANREDRGLLAGLAQHQASRSAVWTIIGALGEHDGSSARDPDALSLALDSCAALAEQLGKVWNEASSRVHAQAAAVSANGIAYAITALAAAGVGPPARDALIVDCTTTDGRCVWPLIGVSAGDGAPVALVAEAVTGSSRVYRLAPDSGGVRIDAGKSLRVHFSLPSLSLLDVVSPRFAAGVTRNAQLFGRAAPPTHRAFVCAAPLATFGTTLLPLGDDDSPIDIGEWSGDPARNPLTRLLDAVFHADSTITRFALNIGAVRGRLAVGSTLDPVPVPVLCVPTVNGDQRMPLMRQAIDAIGIAAADTSAGRLQSLVIELTLSAGERPVLRLRRLLASLATPPA